MIYVVSNKQLQQLTDSGSAACGAAMTTAHRAGWGSSCLRQFNKRAAKDHLFVEY